MNYTNHHSHEVYQPISIQALTPDFITEGRISVYWIDIRRWQSNLARYLTLLSPSEYRRYSRFRETFHAERYAIAHGFLRQLLNILQGKAYLSSDMEFTQNEFGKLSLPEVYKKDIEFNLSYSSEYVLFGFSRGMPLGVDIEVMGRMDVNASTARIIMMDEEFERWESFDQDRKETSFHRMWVRKEAIMKAYGTGVQLPPDQFSVGLLPDEGQVEIDIAHNQVFYYQQIDFDATITACLATMQPISQVTCYQLLPEAL